jgi:VanZ family protein
MIRGLLATAIVLITWLALTPSPPEAAGLVWDKANHALAFFVLAGLAQYSVVERDLYMWGGLIVYGVGIEIVQWLGGYRVFELTDIVADIVGIGLFVLLSPLLIRLPLLKSLKQFKRRELV